MKTADPPTSTHRVAQHRARLRRAGMKKIEMWVPDPSTPEFARQARKESLAARRDPQDHEVLDWIESLADTSGWKA